MKHLINFCTGSWNIGCQVIPFLTQNSGTSTELGLAMTPTRESQENCNWSAWCLPEWSAGNSCNEKNICMMTISNGNIFRITGIFIGHRCIPLTKASDAELWCFLWPAPEQMFEQTIKAPVIWDAIALIMASLWWHTISLSRNITRFSTIVWYLFYVFSIMPDYYLKFIHLVLKHEYIPRDYVNIN